MKPVLKKILSLTWKVGLGLLGLGALILGLLVADVWYSNRFGRYYSNDKTLSKDVVVEAYHNNTVRVRNKATGKYTTPKIRWVAGTPERDSLTVFCNKKGKRGFLNVKTGEIVIPAQYSKAWQFSEGLGAVLWRDDKIGFVDHKNRPVIEYVIPYEKGFDYIFKDGYCVVRFWETDKYRYAAFRKDGKMVLGWNYTRIDEPNKYGYRVVANEDGYWLADRDFNKVLPDTYDYVSIADENTGVYVTKNHIKQLLDFDGTVIEPFVVDNTYRLKYMTKYNSDDPDDYELVPDIVVYQVGRWEGLMDARTGKAITRPDYWGFEMISKDLIRAQFSYDDEGTVMDKRGHIISNP